MPDRDLRARCERACECEAGSRAPRRRGSDRRVRCRRTGPGGADDGAGAAALRASRRAGQQRGRDQVGPVEAMTISDYERAMRVMFWGTVYPTLALLPQFTSRKSGRVVNITSIGGKVAVPHLLPYTCAKFAAVGFSEGLHGELRESGVKVVTIAPGLMRTGSYLNADFKGDAEKESPRFGINSRMPGLNINGERAARQIADATSRGTAEKVLTTPANLLARAHGLAPGLTSEILGMVGSLLPSGDSKTHTRGHETRS